MSFYAGPVPHLRLVSQNPSWPRTRYYKIPICRWRPLLACAFVGILGTFSCLETFHIPWQTCRDVHELSRQRFTNTVYRENLLRFSSGCAAVVLTISSMTSKRLIGQLKPSMFLVSRLASARGHHTAAESCILRGGARPGQMVGKDAAATSKRFLSLQSCPRIYGTSLSILAWNIHIDPRRFRLT